MDSLSPKNKMQTRSKTSKKNVKKSDNKIPISDKKKNASSKRKRFRKAGGIIYIGHIPHGFYEDEMKSYFNQFGKVLATTVARSKKTGRSKGYGFVEFKDEEVAKIAAETMNNYLMFNKILKCRYIPPEEKKGRILERKISRYDFPKQKNRKTNLEDKEKAFSNLTQSSYLEKAQAKIEKFKNFFQERGIDFNFQLNSKSQDSNSKHTENKAENAHSTGSESESKDNTDTEFGVLEIDESDNEISFKTPPQVKKVIKKSFSSSATPVKEVNSNKSKGKKEKINLLKKSKSDKTQRKGKIEKKTISKKLGKNIKSRGKTLRAKEFLLKDTTAHTIQKKGKGAVSVGFPVADTKEGSQVGDSKIKKKIIIPVKYLSLST